MLKLLTQTVSRIQRTTTTILVFTLASDKLVSGSGDAPGKVFQISTDASRLLAQTACRLRAADIHDGRHTTARWDSLIGCRCYDVMDHVIGCRGDFRYEILEAVGKPFVELTHVTHQILPRSLPTSACRLMVR